jgi:cellulose synthase/poly-beta-1,6-N-acetylglucosamine synthase-like glycosyltransferase
MSVFGHVLVIVALVLGVVLLVAVGVLALQVLAHALAPREPAGAGAIAAPRAPLAVLVPAHNEEDGIAAALATVVPQLLAGDRLLVVADNCADATAAAARAAGAEVVERASALRGKGYALAYGVDHLRADPPSAVVIVDADCRLAPGTLAALADRLERTGRPVQALYLMVAPADAGLGRRLAQFAWRVRNWVRPAGWHRLGGPCQLMGTGMAFSWAMLQDARLANASIVEDMKLGIDLAVGGAAPVFCERALVTSEFPVSTAASGTQRTRWEHGHLEMILREGLPLLFVAIRRGDARLLGLALDLCVPPLALLAGLLGLDWLVALAGRLLGGGAAGLVLASTLLTLFVGTILVAWATRGRDLVRLGELLAVPWYILAKVPMYLRFIVRRQKDWVRTDRK